MSVSSRAQSRAALVFILLVAASPAFAQATTGAGGSLTSLLQNVVTLLNSGVVRLLAILAVMVTAAAAMFGRLDLHRALTVVVAISVIFGAATIVDAMTGGTGA